MSATVTICERNGGIAGVVTENVTAINYKATDSSGGGYTGYQNSIAQGTNSYAKYIYIKFAGSYSTIANVTVTHHSGILSNGVSIMTSPTIALDSEKLPYVAPTREKNNVSVTNYDFSPLNSVVGLLIGKKNSTDPAYSSGKTNSVDNPGEPVYTNYFVSQLQTSANSGTGNVGPVVIEISYDEV